MFLRQTLRKTFLLSVVFRPWCLRTEHHSRIPPTAVGGSFKLSLRQIEAYEHKYPRRESGDCSDPTYLSQFPRPGVEKNNARQDNPQRSTRAREVGFEHIPRLPSEVFGWSDRVPV